MTRKKMPGVKSVETRYMEEREAVLRALGRLNRRDFIKVSAGALGAAAAVGVGLHPHSFTPVSVAFAQPENEAPPAEPGAPGAAPGTAAKKPADERSFKFAYISDSHLYKRELNDRFVRSLLRAVDDVNMMDPQPDFVLYGGDLAQLGQREELDLGAQILKGLKAPVRMMVGEHDWYRDMGERWKELVFTPEQPWKSDDPSRFYAENKRVSNARAKAELGWRPADPTYREGLAAILPSVLRDAR